MASPSIELQNVTVSFGPEVIVRNVSLSIEKGESLVLVGPSGQGKSVMLKLMAGILKPNSGHVFIEGQDIHAVTEAEKDKVIRKMGMLFQKNALFDSLTSGENIGFPLREVAHMPESQVQERIDDYLEKVAISHARDLYPDEISGGMQKRLGIARALALDPEIILYDDPTAGLDPITSKMIVELILKIKKERNATVVAITNDMNRAYQLADRIAMVVDGELVVTGDEISTKSHKDPRVHQFIRGELQGPLTEGL